MRKIHQFKYLKIKSQELRIIKLLLLLLGHGELLELRLLEKSARHVFIIARQRSSNKINFGQLLDNELICGSTGFEQ